MAGFDFAGKTVWVTGAGKGIGYTTALAFANAGAEVTGFDREFLRITTRLRPKCWMWRMPDR